MLDVLLTGSVSFVITFLAIPVIIRIAEEKKLYDVPNDRKLHKNPIASLGGVGMFSGFFLAAMGNKIINWNFDVLSAPQSLKALRQQLKINTIGMIEIHRSAIKIKSRGLIYIKTVLIDNFAKLFA